MQYYSTYITGVAFLFFILYVTKLITSARAIAKLDTNTRLLQSRGYAVLHCGSLIGVFSWENDAKAFIERASERTKNSFTLVPFTLDACRFYAINENVDLFRVVLCVSGTVSDIAERLAFPRNEDLMEMGMNPSGVVHHASNASLTYIEVYVTAANENHAQSLARQSTKYVMHRTHEFSS